MKKIIYLLIIIILCFFGCKTEEPQNPPTVITNAASDVSIKIATINGEVINEGFLATTDRGFVFSDKNTNPSVSDIKVQSGYGKGVYSIVLDKLLVNTKYYFKAYATNIKGTAYGEVKSFTTADYKLPITITAIPKNITYTTVELAGSVTDEGGGTVTENGFVVGTNASPTLVDLKFPIAKGKAILTLIVNKLNVNTKYYVRTYAINEKGIAYGNEQGFTTIYIPTVTSKTGRIWLDRNLGASQVATSSTDEASYGDLYQWGRGADGHQLRTSPITNVNSKIDAPGNSNFILGTTSPFADWRNPQNDNLWQGVNGINNVCPTGFRIPTIIEWDQELKTWGSRNNQAGFTSSLKLPEAGYRNFDLGSLSYVGAIGYYWSSTAVSGTGSSVLQSQKNYAGIEETNGRAYGYSVRCIKD